MVKVQSGMKIRKNLKNNSSGKRCSRSGSIRTFHLKIISHYNIRKKVICMTNLDLTILQPYCENDMNLLKRISKSIFLSLNESLSQLDYDDFYSIGNLVLWQVYNVYNPTMGISFDVFLRNCLKRRFKTEIRDRHREKRVINQLATSLDANNENNEECNILDLIESDFDTFEEVMKTNNQQFEDKAQLYILKLSNEQKDILNLLMNGYKPKDIQQMLNISSNEYAENLKIMRSFENVKILF